MALLRALTALSLATLVTRIISTIPSPVLGTACTIPASTARAAFSASMVSDFPRSRRSRRSARNTSSTPFPLRRIAEASPAPYEPVPSTPNTIWSPKTAAQPIRAR